MRLVHKRNSHIINVFSIPQTKGWVKAIIDRLALHRNATDPKFSEFALLYSTHSIYSTELAFICIQSFFCVITWNECLCKPRLYSICRVIFYKVCLQFLTNFQFLRAYLILRQPYCTCIHVIFCWCFNSNAQFLFCLSSFPL